MALDLADKQQTLEKLKTRMEDMKGLPAMAHSVRLVSKQTSKGSDATVTDITDTILQDFSLTNKILHMVNSAHYIKTQTEGKINTISRAVIILGMDHVRNAALSLMLFENLKDKSLAADLKATMINNFTSGIIAREVARAIGGEHKEEAFLCAMFHDFGKVLVTYYLSEENDAIKDAVSGKGVTERNAALAILGTSYENIGIAVAKEWKLSNVIVYCMGKLPPEIPKPANAPDTLHAVVGFSNELCNIISAHGNDPKAWEKALTALLARFKGSVPIPVEKISEILSIAHGEISDHVNEFNLSGESFGILDNLEAAMGPLPQETPPEHDKTQLIVRVDTGGGIRILETVTPGDVKQTPEEVLSRGVQEVATSLLEDFSVSDILRMILEVMFRGMDFSNVVICIKNSKTKSMEGRFAFGLNTNAIKNSFRFTVDPTGKDVFNTAIARGTDVLVNDVNDFRVAPLIPHWFRLLLDSETFMLMPIIVNKIALGLIYADKPMSGDLNLDTQVLRYLKTLRDQAILAIKQKS
jgi:HD-like signal output (HDOD) protein